MPKYCDKCGEELKNENAKFCDKCGAEVKLPSNQQNNFNSSNMPLEVNEKSMPLAIIISFFLNGLGMAYAGNILKGVGYFIGSIILSLIISSIFNEFLTFIINLIVWIIGLVLTYQEVNEVNQQKRMLLMNSMNKN